MKELKEIKFDWSISKKPEASKTRSAITESKLIVEFKNSEQCRAFIGLLIDQSLSSKNDRSVFFNFEVEFTVDQIDGLDRHIVSIYNINWAQNLKYIAKLLEKVEYEIDY